MPQPIFKRILLKLSGEALAANQGFGVDTLRIHEIAAELADVKSLGVQIAIVVGGGNFFRGVAEQARTMDRVTADHMGMLSTVLNALALQDALEKQGVYTRVQSAIEMNQVAEPFIRRRAIRHLEKERVVIFAGGTGNPYFSTDTAASLRAMEIKAEAILKATKVDGIYDADPMIVKDATKFTEITYMEILKRGLKVMDSTAFSLCQDNKMPIIVFDMMKDDNIKRVVTGQKVGTLWSLPFRASVGEFIKPGRNKLEIEVTNLAANRIRDLDKRKVEWKKFHEINFVNIHYQPFDASNWPLMDSGLLGPVKLVAMKKSEID